MKNLQTKFYIILSLFFLNRDKFVKDTITNIPPDNKEIAYLSDIEFTIFAYFAYKFTHSTEKEKKDFEKTGVVVSYKELNKLYISTPHLATVLKTLQDNKLIKKSTLTEDKRKTNYILSYTLLQKFNFINLKALEFCSFDDSDTIIINKLLSGVIDLLKKNNIVNDEQEKNLSEFLDKSDNLKKFYYISIALWTSRYLINDFQIRLMGPSEFMVYAMIIKHFLKNDKKPITTKRVKDETGLAPSIISQSFKKFIDEELVTRKEINKFKVYFYVNRKELEARIEKDTIIIDLITKNFKKEDSKHFEKFIEKLEEKLYKKLNSLDSDKICKKCGMTIPPLPGLKYCPYCGDII
ncbi:MAG: hypothetical protein ACYCTB_04790 [bacterium]